jgi:DNA-binding CsgD family transcriptional regulator
VSEDRVTPQQDPEQVAARRAAMLAAVPIAVVVLDANACVVETNRAAQRVLGLGDNTRSLHELGRRVADPVSGAPLPPSELPWHRALGGEIVHDRDVAITAPPPAVSRRLITISARPFQDPVSPAAGGAMVLAFDRVQLLLRQTLELDLPPYLRRVLALLGQGRGTAEISAELNITVATTRLYIKRLYARLGVSNRSQLVLRAMDLGFDQALRSAS